MKVAKWTRLLCQASLACSAIFFVEALKPKEAQAVFIQSLYSGQHAWIDYNLPAGEYTLEASALLGDVDIRIYDSNRRSMLLEAENDVGNEMLNFSVQSGGVFSVKYSMFACINIFGACPIDIEVYRR